MSDWRLLPPFQSQHGIPTRTRARKTARTHEHGEDEQPNEHINKRAAQNPPIVRPTHSTTTRRPIPRHLFRDGPSASGEASSSKSSSFVPEAGLRFTIKQPPPPPPKRPSIDCDAWVKERMASGGSLVDTLNATYKHNEGSPSRSSGVPGRRRRSTSTSTNTSGRSPLKRPRLSNTPTASSSSLADTSSSMLSIASSSTSISSTGLIFPSPPAATASVSREGSSQSTERKRRPLPRVHKPFTTPVSSSSNARNIPPLNTATTPPTFPLPTPSSSDASTASPKPATIFVATAASKRATPTAAMSTPTEPTRSGSSHLRPSSPLTHEAPPLLLPLSDTIHAPESTPSLPTHVKAEPVIETLPPPSLMSTNHPPLQPVVIKSEPLAISIPDATPAWEQQHSGTHRVHPIPHNCMPGAAQYEKNRLEWMKSSAEKVRERGVHVTHVKLLPDGLIIDWERRSKPPSRSHSESHNPRSNVLDIPAQSNTPPIHPQPPFAVHAPPDDPSPAPTRHLSPESGASLANVLPAAASTVTHASGGTAAQTMFARLLLKKKMKEMERQAATRVRMEEEAEQRQEEERKKRGDDSSMPKTPPPSNPQPFVLKTPTPPWEREGEFDSDELVQHPAAVPAPGEIQQQNPAEHAPPDDTLGPAQPNDSPTSVKVDLNSSYARRLSPDAQDVFRYLKAEPSSDDDLYLDPSEVIRPTKTEPVRTEVLSSQDECSIERNADAVEREPEQPSMNERSVLEDSQLSLADIVPPVATPSADDVLASSLSVVSPSLQPSTNVVLVPSTFHASTPPAGAPSSTSQPSKEPPPHTSLVLSTTDDTITIPTPLEREHLEDDALEWLKQYIIAFDADRASLSSVYSKEATFCLRVLSHPPQGSANVSTKPELLKYTGIVTGTAKILSTLLGLPLKFTAASEEHPTAEYELVIAFDMVVYGTSVAGSGPGIMVVCYIDPSGPLKDAGTSQRSVCEMQFILRRKPALLLEGALGLEALSHQVVVRRIPADMEWRWC